MVISIMALHSGLFVVVLVVNNQMEFEMLICIRQVSLYPSKSSLASSTFLTWNGRTSPDTHFNQYRFAMFSFCDFYIDLLLKMEIIK